MSSSYVKKYEKTIKFENIINFTNKLIE